MKPTHQPAALPPLNLVAEMKKGITDRGDFPFQMRKGGGFAQVTFNAPPQQFKKPSFVKAWSADAERQSKLLSYRTEKALNLRDALFAELAQQPCNAKNVENLASGLFKLGKKGVLLAQLNWSMGNQRLSVQPVDQMLALLHEMSPTQVQHNLNKLLHPHPTSKVELPAGAINILQRLELSFGNTTTTTTASTGINTTSTSTATSTATSAVVSGASNTTLSTQPLQSTQGGQWAQTDVERLEDLIEATNKNMKKATATYRTYQYSDNALDTQKAQSASNEMIALHGELERLWALKAEAERVELEGEPPEPAG